MLYSLDVSFPLGVTFAVNLSIGIHEVLSHNARKFEIPFYHSVLIKTLQRYALFERNPNF